jgi:hypothetical protein
MLAHCAAIRGHFRWRSGKGRSDLWPCRGRPFEWPGPNPRIPMFWRHSVYRPQCKVYGDKEHVGTPVADSGGTSGQLLENGKQRYRLIFGLVPVSGGGAAEFERFCDAIRAVHCWNAPPLCDANGYGLGAGAADL